MLLGDFSVHRCPVAVMVVITTDSSSKRRHSEVFKSQIDTDKFLGIFEIEFPEISRY